MLQYAAPKGLKQWAEIYCLYQKAFPKSEKKPLPFSAAFSMWFFAMVMYLPFMKIGICYKNYSRKGECCQ